ncbi:flagellar biosynthetic protein FliR [Amaricoccus solimangrovi]|uniref:Flagellar biosynthetic protein FliR n=1 Tax=Amaricoccus solimangrovi TaxID=2589815 RepID=A0A501WWI9_9RHOB|nr:flagellar biosynthetic protein FliR [Amaricoccus solimangrovi]TPE52504.1 flagellar biosynthetic protein FliR [Amaricoccus solimangrovi]
MIAEIGRFLDLTEAGLAGFILVFARVGGVMALLPGFGEQMIPARVRLGLTVAFAMVVWPMVAATSPGAPAEASWPFLAMLLVEALIGLLLGLGARLLLLGLQFAGTVIAQSTSLAQLLGGGVTPEPMPAMGALLALGGMTLAVATGLHVKAALLIARSYEVLPMGLVPAGTDVATWGVARVASSFALGFSLAAPFVIAAFAYNLALGAINRAMPQLMVSFIGAPAAMGGGILLLMLAAPVILRHWNAAFDALLADPLAMPR